MSFYSKYKEYVSQVFKQHITAGQLALIITISLILTTFPIIGFTTIVATAIGIKYKMNLPVLIFIVYLFEPVRFLMFIPLVEIGTTILGIQNFEISVDTLKNSFTNGLSGFLSFCSYQLLYALLGWLVVSALVSTPFYFLLKRILKFLFTKYHYIFSLKNV